MYIVSKIIQKQQIYIRQEPENMLCSVCIEILNVHLFFFSFFVQQCFKLKE